MKALIILIFINILIIFSCKKANKYDYNRKQPKTIINNKYEIDISKFNFYVKYDNDLYDSKKKEFTRLYRNNRIVLEQLSISIEAKRNIFEIFKKHIHNKSKKQEFMCPAHETTSRTYEDIIFYYNGNIQEFNFTIDINYKNSICFENNFAYTIIQIIKKDILNNKKISDLVESDIYFE